MKMADTNKFQLQRKIPVFTVLKNGAVLKNIFVVKGPPSPLSQSMAAVQDHKEEVLLVGRHPHCNIVLTHPSISRFHLQIFSDSSAHKIFVMDLSSVHGTWVSERKIDPGVRVELREGDKLRLGGSSRVYRLHWVPLEHAYDLENSFLSGLDAAMAEEKEEEEDKVIQEELEVEECQEEPPVEAEYKDTQYSEAFFTPDNNGGQEENLCFDENRTKEVNTSDLPLSDIEPLAFGETSPMLGILEENLYLSASNPELKNSSDILVDSLGSIPFKESSPVLIDMALSIHPEGHSGLGINLESTQAPSETYVKVHDQEKHSYDFSATGGDENSMVMLEHDYPEGYSAAASFEENDCCLDTENNPRDDSIPLKESSPLLEGMMSSFHPEENSGFGVDLESSHQAPSQTYVKVYEQVKHSCLDGSAELSGANENSMVVLGHDCPEVYSAAATPEENDNCLDTENNQRDDLRHCPMSGANENSMVISEHDCPEGYSATATPEENDNCLDTENNPRDDPKHCPMSGADENSMVILEQDCPEGYSAAATSEENDGCLDTENNPRDDLKHCPMLFHPVPAQAQPSLPENLSKIKSQQSTEVKADNSTVQESLSTILANHGDPYDYESNNLSEDHIPRMDGQEGRDDLSVHQVTPSVDSFMPFQEILCDQKLNIEKHSSPEFDEENGNSPIARCGTKSNLPSIWSRRGKPATDLHLKTGKSRKTRSSILDNKNQNNEENFENIPRTLFNNLEGEEEEIFTPDKENLMPKALKNAIKIGRKHSEPFGQSILKSSSILSDCMEDEIYHSPDKENHTPRVLGVRKKMKHVFGNRSCLQETSRVKRRDERLPFKSLQASPGSQLKSTEFDASPRENLLANGVKLNENQSGLSANVFPGQPNGNWIMIVDTSSFLKKESWKSLQLLQGLKGTQLIIPRIVIRELNCIRQSFSLFRRATKVSSIMEWIEESMLNTRWWVHVQNSLEEGKSVAPTPTATPHHQLDDGSEDFPTITSNSASISSCVSVHTPTTEDNVLECALIFKKLKSNGKLVLLSNDVSLKINAMAEGILCETAEEFRESLVNPLSDRFIWVDSSPKGQSWSFAADIPEEKYSRSPWKKSSRGHGARGLKLILLHNSHYGKISSFSSI